MKKLILLFTVMLNTLVATTDFCSNETALYLSADLSQPTG